MKVILDTSTISGEGQSSFRYFSELIPRLRKESDISLDILPSPYFQLPLDWKNKQNNYRPLIPKASWIPQGKIRKALSRIKWAIEGKRQEKAFFGDQPQRTIFHTFLYSIPHSPDTPLVSMALDTIPEKLGRELGIWDSASKIIKQKELSLKQAKRVIAISQSTKKDVCDFYGISDHRIDTIYLAVNTDFFTSKSSSTEKSQLILKHKISRPYLLQVGGRLHHRNFERLAEAFALSKLNKDYLLVCAGELWSDQEKELLKKLGIASDTLLVNNPNNLELRNIYQEAQMLVYPSLYEGFGFPLVEAMASGVPVATSFGGGSIPEVAGEAALYFDPRNPEDMARVISKLLEPQLAKEYREKGLKNVERFSWDKTAAETVACYYKVFSE
jgi:glycosyltransferase involved in cell wall biosynthesis